MAKETPANLNKTRRPPIVVVVGHVDHGKTTLLDYIRKANVAGREAGGITQATGAYEIEHVPAASASDGAAAAEKTRDAAPAPRRITFIDTPGHEAFTAMRSRGAQVADLAILVIAADEGMKPQTKEAIAILEEAKTPFIVAINKIDKVGGNLEKAKNDLAAAGVLLEGFGGQVSYHGVSAKTGEGVDDLLDLILLAADLEDLTCDLSAPASGYVLEVRRDPRRGIETTVIVKDGTLARGDAIATPSAAGKTKILENFLGKTADRLTPSAPAIVIGFETLPRVGELFFSGGDLTAAGAVAPAAAVASATASAAAAAPAAQKTTLSKFSLNLILKASDGGSLEALSVVLRSVDQKGGKTIHIVDEAVGDITDGDVKRAQATGATIIGFKNRVEKGARTLAEAQSVAIITSEVVYDLSKAVEEFLVGARGPAILGELEVLAVFNQERNDKQLVGGRIESGVFRGKMPFELRRGDLHDPKSLVGTGRVLGLREKKAEITQAEKGKEIGVLAAADIALQIGDRLVIRK